jgi:CBS domain-containing membrane protein
MVMPPTFVRDLMSSPVITLRVDQTLPAVEDLMLFEHVRHLPVIDDERHVVGLVTHRDLLRAQLSSLTGLTGEQRRARQAGIRVDQLMTTAIWTVKPDLRAAIAGEMILGNRIGCLPVVDEDRRLIGIVTERDFVRRAVDALEAELTAA